MHIMQQISDWWQHQSWLEICGFITGVLCVVLAAANKIWNWPIAIISVTIYIYIFFNASLYADMCLQVYFLGFNIYGWYFWSRKRATEVKIPVISATKKQVITAVIVVTVVTPILGFVLTQLKNLSFFKPASYPYLDSFLTTCSFVAQYFLAKKILQNWLIWIFVDIIYVGVYIFKGLDITAAMYAIYIPVAVYGYLDWNETVENRRLKKKKFKTPSTV
jgi:nicotinamide mononucleotide transporter